MDFPLSDVFSLSCETVKEWQKLKEAVGAPGMARNQICTWKNLAWECQRLTEVGTLRLLKVLRPTLTKNLPKRSDWFGRLHQCKQWANINLNLKATKNTILSIALLLVWGWFTPCCCHAGEYLYTASEPLTRDLVDSLGSSNPSSYFYHNAHSVCWKWYRLQLHRQWSYHKDRILYPCSRPRFRISYRYVISILNLRLRVSESNI